MTDHMTRRPRTVSGTAGPGLIGVPPVRTVLPADADPDARPIVRDPVLEGTGPAELGAVAMAAELDDYPHRQRKHEARRAPALIVIDAGQPGCEEAVPSIKARAEPRRIPVVVLDRDPVAAAYHAGANTVIPRPLRSLALRRLMEAFTGSWLDAAVPPAEHA